MCYAVGHTGLGFAAGEIASLPDTRKVNDPGEVYLQGLAQPSVLAHRTGENAVELGVQCQRSALQGWEQPSPKVLSCLWALGGNI